MTARLLILAKKNARRAQLDLLLRSTERFWPDATAVVIDEPAGPEFNERVQWEIRRDAELISFATDDGFFYRPVPEYLADDALCFTLRLGANTHYCYPSGQRQRIPSKRYTFHNEEGDFAYPGSIDAHVFCAEALRELIGEVYLDNPTALECILTLACDQRGGDVVRPDLSCYVSVPVNRVSEQSGVRFGQYYPQSAESMNLLYDRGRRIDLDFMVEMARRNVKGAHWELPFVWESERAAA